MSPAGKRLLATVAAINIAPLLVLCFLLVAVAAWLPSAIGQAGHGTSSSSATGAAVAGGKVPAAYRGLINQWGHQCQELTPGRLAALLHQESGFNPRAGSGAGAQGIAQFTPGTWHAHGRDANKDGRASVWDPADAIPSAATYLCSLANAVKAVPGDRVMNMLAAYNAGVGAVRQYHGIPPYAETRHYVRAIRTAEKTYTDTGSGGQAVSGSAGKVIAAARKEFGTPYVWGGGNSAGPTKGGFDCSGLMMYAFHHGTSGKVTLPRTSQEQRHVGRHVAKLHIKPGDLVVVNNDGSWGHVVLAIGHGRAIEAPRTGKDVRETPLSAYAKYPWDVRRVLQ